MSNSNYPTTGSVAEVEDALNDAARELRKAEDAATEQVRIRRERASLYDGADSNMAEALVKRFPALRRD